ncbi:hypothetical protein [Streptomyces sp. LaPpAH-108]|uniref:hypothetical protein n=1 Tax=Streptomyces sp. LaPpAH-108 TaxID=1155714 RepID=UPI0003699A78|nr:hypothetical protein [Streptomyces sp. LaPpAH-108]
MRDAYRAATGLAKVEAREAQELAAAQQGEWCAGRGENEAYLVPLGAVAEFRERLALARPGAGV